MQRERVYLDYNATAPLRPEVREALCAALGAVGNPSSIHAEGRAAKALIERARGQVARLLGTSPRSVVFASGGTEAANLALSPGLNINGDPRPFERLLLASVEHPCVLKGHRFAGEHVTVLPVAADGTLDLAVLDEELSAGGRALVAVQLANNETGVIQDVEEVASQVHAAGGALVCDAVQAAGRMKIDLARLGADAVFVSAHKLGGPKGVGALAFADERTHIADVTLRGGGQERGLRAGTENVAAIAGFGAACEALGDIGAEAERLQDLRESLADGVRAVAPEAVVFGAHRERLSNTLAFALEGLPAETLLIALDLAGISVSSGSACSSGKVAASHVLAAMGVPPALARCAIRVSLGWGSSARDVKDFAAAFSAVASAMQARHRAAA